jgi:hypothetical protein
MGLRCDDAGAVWIDSGETWLMVPRHPEAYAVWMGPIRRCEQYAARYGIDRVLHVDQMAAAVVAAAPACVYVLSGTNSDSGNLMAPPPIPFVVCLSLSYLVPVSHTHCMLLLVRRWNRNRYHALVARNV